MFHTFARARHAVAAFALFIVTSGSLASPVYTLTPLVTDDQDVLAAAGFGPAATVDPNLINPWGISLSSQGPFWVSNQGSDSSTLYDGEGTPFPVGSPLLVSIPHAGPPSGPTGQVFAGGSGLTLPGGSTGLFFFANLDGSISGWSLDLPDTTQAVTVVSPSAERPAVYTGLAIGQMGTDTFLYAANNLAGSIDVFDSSYQPVTLDAGAFGAGDNPDGLVPFNVQNIGGLIYVTYAPADEADASELGTGFVNVFNSDGTFVRRIDSDQFASPWGMTLAPDDFGDFSNALLVGNFNEEFGYINAFDPTTGEFLGTLLGGENSPLNIPYLWGLAFGNGVLSDLEDLYFAAGIGDEEHGLFGEIGAAGEQAPEPGTLGTLLLGAIAIGWTRRARVRRA